jgi:small subunit ribosomal protein S6e
MPFKINISEKTGKTFHLESESPGIVGKKLREKVSGGEISPDLAGYEFEIAGASDRAGFTAMGNVEGFALRKVLLGYGKGMKKRSRKEGKKKRGNLKPHGLRLRKTVRGNTISEEISQVNLKVLKEGSRKLSEIFPEQNKAKEEKPAEANAQATA